MSESPFSPMLVKWADQLSQLPMSEAQLVGMAKLTVLWNSAERKLQAFIGELLNKGHAAELITADMGGLALAHLARNLAHLEIKDKLTQEYVDASLEAFDKCRIVRNEIVHGLPERSAIPTETLMQSSARKGRGELVITSADISEKRLANLVQLFAILNFAMDCCLKLVWGHRMQDLGQIRREDLITFPPVSAVIAVAQLAGKTKKADGDLKGKQAP